MNQQQADVTLIAACQQGDSRAYRHVYELYKDRVYGLCRSMSGNDEDAADLMQDVFISAFTVMTQVVTRTFADMQATWDALLKIGMTDAELETNPEFMQVAAPSDTVVLIAFEVNFARASGLVNLCYPYFTLEPVINLFNVQNWANRRIGRQATDDSTVRQDRLDQLRTIDTNVTAVAGYGSLPARELASVREGDTIVLDTRVGEPGVVFVENVPTFYANPGIGESDRLAVEIDRSVPIQEARKYKLDQ